MESNDYDLVYKSKVDFGYQESGNYNSQIMKFLNYIIGLPNKMVGNDENQEKASKKLAKSKSPLMRCFSQRWRAYFAWLRRKTIP